MGCIRQIGFCPWLFLIYLKQTNTSASTYCFLLQVINFLLSIFCCIKQFQFHNTSMFASLTSNQKKRKEDEEKIILDVHIRFLLITLKFVYELQTSESVYYQFNYRKMNVFKHQFISMYEEIDT